MNSEQRHKEIITLINELAETTKTDNSCLNCRYARKAKYRFISQCKNPVAYLIKRKYNDTEFPTLHQMRSLHGYCGPEGLIFEKRNMLDKILFWRQPTESKTFIGFTISALLIAISVTMLQIFL